MSKQLIVIIASLFAVQLGVYYWSHNVNVANQVAINNLKNEFQEEFANPAKVTTLDLSGRDLITIPNDFSVFSNVKYIDLSNNQLTEVPDWLLGMKLFELNLSHNQLTQIPNFKNASILNLNLSHNKISFPSAGESSKEIYMPKDLKVLNLSDNNIQYLPSTLDFLGEQLKEINVSNNPIDAVDIPLLSIEKIIMVNTSGFNNEFVKNTKHTAPNYENKIENYNYNYSHTNWKTHEEVYDRNYPFLDMRSHTSPAGLKTPNLRELIIDNWKRDILPFEVKDTLVVENNDTMIYQLPTNFIDRDTIYIPNMAIDDNLSSFEKLEILKVSDIQESNFRIYNNNIELLSIKSKNRYLRLAFGIQKLETLIINENTLKGILRGGFTAPILKTLIIERENNEDITSWISKFQELHPKVEIKVIQP